MRLSRLIARFALAAALVIPLGVAAAAAAPGADVAHPIRDGRMAFADYNTRQIYTVNPDGTALVQLTDVPSPHRALMPVWSPDSSRILFVSDANGEARMYTMWPDGSHWHLITHDPHGTGDLDPSYTPDGHTIVYDRCVFPAFTCAVYSIRTDGTDRHALTRFSAHGGDDFSSVSPRGTLITFSRYDVRGISSQVWVMRLDGSHAHPVTPVSLEANYSSWSRDGRYLFFSSSAAHVGESLYRARVNGTGLTELTDPRWPYDDFNATEAPAGDRIALVSDRGYSNLCCEVLYVMRPGGAGLHRVSTGLTGVQNLAWGSAPLLTASSAHVSPDLPRAAESTQRPGPGGGRARGSRLGIPAWVRGDL